MDFIITFLSTNT